MSDYTTQNKQMRHDELFRLYLVFQEMRIAGVQVMFNSTYSLLRVDYLSLVNQSTPTSILRHSPVVTFPPKTSFTLSILFVLILFYLISTFNNSPLGGRCSVQHPHQCVCGCGGPGESSRDRAGDAGTSPNPLSSPSPMSFSSLRKNRQNPSHHVCSLVTDSP